MVPKILLTCLLVLLAASQIPADTKYVYVDYSLDPKELLPAHILEIKDGDTVRATIELGWGVSVTDDIRFLDFDAWETSKRRKTVDVTDEEIKKGKVAKEFLTTLTSGRQLYCLHTNQREVYGRILTKFYFYDKSNKLVDVSATMKENGHERNP